MLKLIISFLFLIPFSLHAEAVYKVSKGKLHRKGKVTVSVLPEPHKYKVQMSYNIKKKNYVTVPDKFLQGETIMEFPEKFKTEAGYKELQKKKEMMIPKAKLVFLKRETVGDLKDAYFIEVRPTNKKSKIEIIYHPSLPEVGWKEMDITFLSNIPVLDGYEIEAKLK